MNPPWLDVGHWSNYVRVVPGETVISPDGTMHILGIDQKWHLLAARSDRTTAQVDRINDLIKATRAAEQGMFPQRFMAGTSKPKPPTVFRQPRIKRPRPTGGPIPNDDSAIRILDPRHIVMSAPPKWVDLLRAINGPIHYARGGHIARTGEAK